MTTEAMKGTSIAGRYTKRISDIFSVISGLSFWRD